MSRGLFSSLLPPAGMVAPAGAAAAEEQAPRPPRFPGASQAHWACDLRRRNRQAQTVDIDELMKRAPLDFYAFLHFATYLGLGFVKWKRLHRLSYIAALCGIVHFVWRVKADLRQP